MAISTRAESRFGIPNWYPIQVDIGIPNNARYALLMQGTEILTRMIAGSVKPLVAPDGFEPPTKGL
jgi:hypothetical protein